MKKIAILGSGGFAKEVLFLIEEIGGYDIVAFVDVEEKESLVIAGKSYQVISEKQLSELGNQVNLTIGIGDPKLIRKLADKFKGDFTFPNLVHPSVIGNFKDIILGEGNIITASCIFTTSITIGSFNVFNLGVTVGHDAIIGDCNVLNPMVNISGGVKIGNSNLIGVNATILQYKNVGNNSIVGAASLVTKNVDNDVTVVGVPAIKITK
ncbi:sugar O-acyltransferase, sialic acid O-acetyltransferase NeuD family [Chitinophaga terrae (ex Kim and Jung 2007)]|uniref:Sugar O-acyltransferase, sialic acid O-acetyltransferase NeuD family n=1 Tax=Chitinophaga terrae (ex Kim and Jung 2007) TaxID=408074 RepID=A0A1H3XX31_9BACT|nr:acetyltransferase [Chitinophaga terrae (ex Kim and Jung 2007)]GEP89447.1 serine O-acetyltransferase [Chitinophaga terrae (ex Kim and Jung 2007)]SEA03883.1 sugar O-acyltransferase, sialic acid O-acetyltransferase NeuD family [Chitinophaga terrae (ex Kim and Jung 2007)]